MLQTLDFCSSKMCLKEASKVGKSFNSKTENIGVKGGLPDEAEPLSSRSNVAIR